MSAEHQVPSLLDQFEELWQQEVLASMPLRVRRLSSAAKSDPALSRLKKESDFFEPRFGGLSYASRFQRPEQWSRSLWVNYASEVITTAPRNRAWPPELNVDPVKGIGRVEDLITAITKQNVRLRGENDAKTLERLWSTGYAVWCVPAMRVLGTVAIRLYLNISEDQLDDRMKNDPAYACAIRTIGGYLRVSDVWALDALDVGRQRKVRRARAAAGRKPKTKRG